MPLDKSLEISNMKISSQMPIKRYPESKYLTVAVSFCLVLHALVILPKLLNMCLDTCKHVRVHL